MKFEEWLLKQKCRDDIVGDLANDYNSSLQNRRLFTKSILPINRLKCDRELLNYYDACLSAYEALAEAKNEYRKTLWKKQ